MLLEAKHTQKNQYVKVGFSEGTNKDFDRYIKFLTGNSRSYGSEKEENEKIKELEGRLKDKLIKKIDRDWSHRDSIYPKDSEYGRGYKMVVDTTNQRVLFYKIYKNKDNENCVTIHKCPHYKDFIKDLEEKGIEPKKDADPNILLDLLEVERHIAVKESPKEELSEELDKKFNERKKELEKKLDNWKKEKDSDDKEEVKSNEISKEEKKEEVIDPKTKKKIKKVKHIGERGGKYYIDDNGNKIYPTEWNESVKGIKEILLESLSKSKIKSLCEYIKIKMVG